MSAASTDAAGDPVATALASLAADPRALHVATLPGRPARHGALRRPLPPEIAALVPDGGLWSHQAEAIDLLRAGTSVAVTTGTASGKSLCYQLPAAEAVVAQRPGTTLVVVPTKALANDQLRSLWDLRAPGLVPATFDGDSSPEDRSWVRSDANVVLTNPEMLHHVLLPDHRRWGTFLLRLRYVVVDELHALRGTFGAHVAHLLRRLRRLAAHHGADPTFCFTSATLGEADALAAALSGLPVVEVSRDGAPRGERHVVLWGAPPEEDGRRPSPTGEVAHLVGDLTTAGLRTLAFCRSRRLVEVVADAARAQVAPGARERIRAYRGGYLADERRSVEEGLASGELDAVVATSALELGIDVGALDACVLHGFPGTIASMWQQIGRAGRSTRPSLAVVVAFDDQLDQWFVSHPAELLRRPPEPAVVNVANPHVLDAHLACAAFEAPLRPADERWWPGLLDEALARLVAEDRLAIRPRGDEPRAVWTGRGRPGDGLGLRGGSAGELRIVTEDDVLVGTVDADRAPLQLHPGASYLHQGRPWTVRTLDLAGRRAVVAEDDGTTYTQAQRTADLHVEAVDDRRPVGDAVLVFGSVEVTTVVTGYRRFDASTRRLVATEPLDLPPTRLRTRAFWYELPDALLERADVLDDDLPGALHAAEHALIALLPLFAICDRWDVGGLSTPWHDDVGAAAIFVHDAAPGGAGVAELGWRRGDAHVRATAALLAACTCRTGCPSCVQSPKCGNGNEPLSKAGAQRLLDVLGATG